MHRSSSAPYLLASLATGECASVIDRVENNGKLQRLLLTRSCWRGGKRNVHHERTNRKHSALRKFPAQPARNSICGTVPFESIVPLKHSPHTFSRDYMENEKVSLPSEPQNLGRSRLCFNIVGEKPMNQEFQALGKDEGALREQ